MNGTGIIWAAHAAADRQGVSHLCHPSSVGLALLPAGYGGSNAVGYKGGGRNGFRQYLFGYSFGRFGGNYTRWGAFGRSGFVVRNQVRQVKTHPFLPRLVHLYLCLLVMHPHQAALLVHINVHLRPVSGHAAVHGNGADAGRGHQGCGGFIFYYFGFLPGDQRRGFGRGLNAALARYSSGARQAQAGDCANHCVGQHGPARVHHALP